MASSTTTEPLSLPSGIADETHGQAIWQRQFSRFLPGLTTAGCIAFGIALIANTQLADDGGWFWYAVLHHNGLRLYRDLHLVLQPFAVLETEWWMDLVGKGWIVSKVPAVLHLVAFTAAIALLAAKSKLANFPRALLIAFVFFVGIHFEHYRFDDYHVIFHVTFLFSILFLLKLGETGGASSWRWVVALGVLSGLGIMTKSTDGVAVCLCAALAIPYQIKARRLAHLAVFLAVTVLVILTVIVLTGDSLKDYAASTVFAAAGAKGGLGSVLFRPLLLFWNTLVYLSALPQILVVLCCGVAAASWTWLVASYSRPNLPTSAIKATIGLALLLAALFVLKPIIVNGEIIVVLSGVCVVAEYGIVLFLCCRVIVESLQARGTRLANPQRVILLLPFAILLTGGMSSAGYHFGLYDQVAFFVLVAVVLFPALFEKRGLRSCFLLIVALMTVSAAYRKAMNPASWHGYSTFPLFSHRLLVHHPAYGPMVIDENLHDFVEGICGAIKSGGQSQLLSIPEPYANYYCDIPPWQGFVQSFFDTSGKEIITDMITKLQRSPPQWILYQRQLENLAMHERGFNNGKRLPHRDLDEFIVGNLESGRWQLVWRAQYGYGNDWLLMRTR